MVENTENTENGMASLVDVKNFFEYPTGDLSAFRKDWQKFSEKDKEQIRLGIGNGSLTY
jgi:hypothetical protein